MKQPTSYLTPSVSQTVSFADVAHQTIIFDRMDPTADLVLKLIDTPWVQRLRNIKQTGNTNLVYMFAEHSRFGHSIGVSYLAYLLMQNLMKRNPETVSLYRSAVSAAGLLHDIGHVAPGSHIAAQMWAPEVGDTHEEIGIRVIEEDACIRSLLEAHQEGLSQLVSRILGEDPSLPHWTTSIISGGGWNADRGNWAIVDSAMCSVSYGRYNVHALIDAFRLSAEGDLVIAESRLDALTHFFVARDSMYRQIYQHRVLQAADQMNAHLVLRLRDLLLPLRSSLAEVKQELSRLQIFCDETMLAVLLSRNYAKELPMNTIFRMTENWWAYHVERWTECSDKVLCDLAKRLRERILFKTIRLDLLSPKDQEQLLNEATETLKQAGYDPRYYLIKVDNTDKHRGRKEDVPLVQLDSGEVVPVTLVEPLIAKLLERGEKTRVWMAIPEEIKVTLGRSR